MTHILPILLVAAVMLADAGVTPPGAPWCAGWAALLASLGPFILLAGGVELAMRRAHRRLLADRNPRWIRRAERVLGAARILTLVQHLLAVLCFGWLQLVRGVTGDLILVDELICILPALIAVSLSWASYYRIDRRLRESLLVRLLDEGRPIFDMLTLRGYVALQIRLHVLLTLVPLLIIVAVSETLRVVGPKVWPGATPDVIDLAATAAALVVLLIAPVIVVALQDVRPLPTGPLRERLLDACRRHRVRVRELFIWNTGGVMINAAVMGFMRGVRYILMTDALLQTMPPRQIEAVMAHEIGHVRRGHMPWMLVGLFAVISASLLLVDVVFIATAWATDTEVIDAATQQWIDLALIGGAAALTLLGFGWISRRFERQADVFAVQHLSGMNAPHEAELAVDDVAVETMSDALTAVAELNAIDADRWSWRHGSIAQRRTYLRSITGQPLTKLAVDRQVRWIKRVAASWLLVLGAWAGAEMLGWRPPWRAEPEPTRIEVQHIPSTRERPA